MCHPRIVRHVWCEDLYCITTNLRFADWTQVFLNEQLTAALLDRLTHRAHIVEFTGESFRFKQRLKHQSNQTQDKELSS